MPSQSLCLRSDGETVKATDGTMARGEFQPTKGKRIGEFAPSARPFGYLLLMGLLPSIALSSAPPHIDREGVRIGLPDGPNVARSRDGVWTPVKIPLKAGADDILGERYLVVVESLDGEATPYRYRVPVPAMAANGERVIFAYVRPGSAGATFTLTLQTTDGSVAQTISQLTRNPANQEILEPRELLYLTVGSPLPRLKAAVKPEPAKKENPEEDDNEPIPGFASIQKIADLPDRWFGYEAVDVLVLTTSGDAFAQGLLDMDQARRDALFDWVRRGGRLVFSVGRNQASAAKFLERVPLVDGVLESKVTRPALPSLQQWIGADPRRKPIGAIDLVAVQSGPKMLGLVHEDPTDNDREIRPVVLQSSCGLGRVVLVPFDLDAPPFSDWDGQSAFWKKLHEEIAPRAPLANPNPNPIDEPGGGLAGDLKRNLETFPEVPVISFGWVALFVLFYIVLVGPLDYLLLKKVFKRLEWTWITFPALVVIVSVAAYATAYSVKGDELRINKIDLVEIELPINKIDLAENEARASGQIYGRTWFTLFSPRIENYTIGLEPVAPEWGGPWEVGDPDAPIPPVELAASDGPEASLGSVSQSLFRQPYDYTADAGGLRRLPIPIWATRAFASSWRAPFKDRKSKDRPAPFQAELRLSRDGKALSGALVNQLPCELHGTALFFQGQWYAVGDLAPGETREVGPLFERDVKPNLLADWFASKIWQPRAAKIPSASGGASPSLASHETMRAALFHGVAGGGQRSNFGLRFLDAGWRIQAHGEGPQRRYRAEAILVARTPPRHDRAETISQDGVSPTRLWLDELPETQTQRPPLSGYVQQETYVRIYIPVVSSQ